MFCPNKYHPDWIKMVSQVGETEAYKNWLLGKTSIETSAQPTIKEGVAELFESIPELANAVYEALEFDTKIKIPNYITTARPYSDENIGSRGRTGNMVEFTSSENVDEYRQNMGGYLIQTNDEGRLYITDIEKYNKNSTFKGLGTVAYVDFYENYKHKSQGLTTDKSLTSDGIRVLERLERMGLVYKTDAILIDDTQKHKLLGTTLYKYNKPLYEFNFNWSRNQITPQQKQQAQQLYSQYLDTIFPDSKVKDIVYKGGSEKDIEGFKKFVNKPVFDKELAQKIQDKLQQLYPEIKLNITNNPVWEQGDNVFNQEDYNKEVQYRLKAVEILSSNKAEQVFEKGKKNGWDLNKILTELQIPKEQKQIILDENITDREEIITSLLADNSFVVDINVSKDNNLSQVFSNGKHTVIDNNYQPLAFFDTKEEADNYIKNYDTNRPTQYYSDLTVLGGTNYTENEIATPAIAPSIKGHAQFATDNGIGWFRSDEQKESKQPKYYLQYGIQIPTDTNIEYFNTKEEAQKKANEYNEDDEYGIWEVGEEKVFGASKTRRILEVQSDLFQKGRDKKDLISKKPDNSIDKIEKQSDGTWAVVNTQIGIIESGFKTQQEADAWLYPVSKENQFLQLLNKKNNWVTFFVKSIIQDSAKKGYEKVLFPKGDTAAKIEGHQTLEEFKKQKEDRISELENSKIVETKWDNGKLAFKIASKEEKPIFENLYSPDGRRFNTKKEAIDKLDLEIKTLKQELADVESGKTQLSSIAKFYENTISNILKKNGYNPVEITDEYGNKWNEVSINQARDLSEVLLQRNEANRIIGQANIKAMTVLVDAINQKQDTLPHEYAHHYIAWFRNTPIVQEAIKKWGSEEALVQSIGEQVVKQKGEAYNWWNKFVKWIMNQFNSLSKLEKEELTKILTDAFLTRRDLSSKQDVKGFKEFVQDDQTFSEKPPKKSVPESWELTENEVYDMVEDFKIKNSIDQIKETISEYKKENNIDSFYNENMDVFQENNITKKNLLEAIEKGVSLNNIKDWTRNCLIGKGGSPKAKDGLKPSTFKSGGKWKVVKDLKGYPTHEKGGVDLMIGKDGVSITNGSNQIKAENGLVIPNSGPDGKAFNDMKTYELYTAKTGKEWSTAKDEGLTTGSYDDNLKLRERLLAGEFDNQLNTNTVESTNPVVNIQNENYSTAKNFNTAFKIARQQLGPNQIFEYKGRKYGTNLKGEVFEPSEETLRKNNMNTPKIKERLNDQNEKVVSPYTSKNTVKLEPEYKDWEEKKKDIEEFNKMEQADRIVAYKNKSDDGKNYVIVDKKKGLLHIYEPGNSTPLFSSAIDLGANPGDAQTVTKVKDPNNDGTITKEEAAIARADFSKGNKTTGAGRYYISNIDYTGYGGLPLLNMMNEAQYENYLKTGNIENVATSFHKGFIKDDQSRVSNGCLRCNKTTLDNLVKYLENTSEVYILPEDENNEFILKNDKLIFKANSKENYDEYVDSNNEVQKGQGINRSVNTLNYTPIKLELDEKTFKQEVFQWNDFNDEKEYEQTTKPFVKALSENKQKIMRAAQIDGDTYNDIVKIAFGIYGTESNFGDTHSAVGNLGRAVNKFINKSNASSPDVKSKATTYGVMDDSNSVGYTQIRWSQLNDREVRVLKRLGITSNRDFLNPEKAAIATAAILAVRYQEQLTPDQKTDIETYLPKTWNNRANYSDRVKDNSRYLKVKELY